MIEIIKEISHKWYGPLLLIILISIPTLIPLIRPGYFPTQDYIYVARIYQMEKALIDGHFPVRWVKDFRNGEPLYNFYAPLPYYAGSVIHLVPKIISINLSYLLTVKILFSLAFILSAMAMYQFGKKLLGIYGAFISATLYLYAPYHSVDIYVRGALSEAWSLIFFPLIFLFALNLSQKFTFKNFVLLTLSTAGLFFTHNVMTMIFSPFILLWMGFLGLRSKSVKLLLQYFFSLIWAIGLAATFLLPAFFEKQYVTTDELTKGYFDFRGHFLAIKQWFEPTWGYGASLWGPKDDMSFQVGLAHWGVLSAAAFLLAMNLVLIKSKKLKRFYQLIFTDLSLKNLINAAFTFSILGTLLLSSLFMMHNKSTVIWEAVETLKFTQFPWRFLGISIFFISILGGYLGFFLSKKALKYLIVPLLVVIISVNIGYFKPDSYYKDSVDDHYVGEAVISKNDRLPKDYLPIWVKKIRDEKLKVPIFIQGSGRISNVKYKTAYLTFDVNSSSESAIETPVTYFPGWQLKVNGEKVKALDPDDFGLIRFDLPPGENKIVMQFTNTAIRTISNLISLFSSALLIITFIKYRKFLKNG